MFSGGDKKWAFDKGFELTECANEFGVSLPNQYEICGRHDAPYSRAQALEAFASNLPLDDLKEKAFSELKVKHSAGSK
jgi:hypothetical protein